AAQQRGLTATAGAQQDRELGLVRLEVDVVEHGRGPVRSAQAADAKPHQNQPPRRPWGSRSMAKKAKSDTEASSSASTRAWATNGPKPRAKDCSINKGSVRDSG